MSAPTPLILSVICGLFLIGGVSKEAAAAGSKSEAGVPDNEVIAPQTSSNTKAKTQTKSSTKKAPARKATQTKSATRTRSSSTQSKTRAKTTRRAKPKKPDIPPPVITSPRSTVALRGDIQALINRTRNGDWGVMIASVSKNDTLFQHGVSTPLRPASTLKLISGAAALSLRGDKHSFSTKVLTDGPVNKDGTLKGNLYLQGGGDPSLSTRYFGNDPNAPMQQLVSQLKAMGITAIEGKVVGDASAFDDKLIPDGWLTRYLGAAYAARVSALSLQDNVVWIAVTPNSKGSGNASVTLEPSSSAARLVGSVRTVAGSSNSVNTRKYSDGTIEVSGSIGSRLATQRYSYVVDDPAVFATGSFIASLNAAGIKVNGGSTLGKTPSDAKVVAQLHSPALGRLINAMNRESLNLYAELLFRDAGRGKTYNQVGSVANGNKYVVSLFNSIKVDTAGFYMADGSGLSTNNRVSARTMLQFLVAAHKQPWSTAFHASFPVAGESETLRKRMKGPAQSNLHAKTGTTDDVVSLAGYVIATNGELLAFSFIYNGVDRWIARESIDAMGETLANFARTY